MAAALLICVVDDDPDYRLLVEAIFRRYLPAYSLRLLASGPAFLDALPQMDPKPNLVLLDQHMPSLSGYQTLVAFKQLTEYHSIPVVVMSADASHSEVNRFYQAGAKRFLPKPTDFKALKEMLLTACQHASNQQ